MRPSILFSALGLVLAFGVVHADEPASSPANKPTVVKPKDLNGYFPFTPPKSKDEWEARRKDLREQVLVATGLWPMPEKTPLNPVIHGKIDRDAYTIEKVYFASMPGHYVCGNLYRPKGRTGKLPAVLSPHGHWENGRMADAGEAAGKKEIDGGGEKTMAGARYPLQAVCAQLARMGCVVFHYDMVGNADSTAIAHRQGFTDAEAELRLQSFMGLQTWNSVRALDFLTSLPDVDPKRVGVTGASGGGTQTFILCAIDDRPAAAFPAVMVSTAMQGGCVCENCSLLRVGTGNIELAGLFAPKPLGMSGAKDWTVDIETKGLPELKALYKLYVAEDKVMARCFPQFGHNFNQVSREVMENWFNKYLGLGQPEPVVEQPFQPVPPKELSVFDETHPRPKDFLDAPSLRRAWTERSTKQIENLRPKNATGLGEFRHVVGTALRAMVEDRLPGPDAIVLHADVKEEKVAGLRIHHASIGRKGEEGSLPALGILPEGYSGTVVIWVHPKGRASVLKDGVPTPAARAILDKNAAILAFDLAGTGDNTAGRPFPVDKHFAGFTYGYNRSLLADRVHDLLTAVAFARTGPRAKHVHLVGWEEAGPWVVLARALCGDAVEHCAADVNHFRFDQVRQTDDPMMLPGALKYGGLGAFAALVAPGDLFVFNHQGTGVDSWAEPAYQAAEKADRLKKSPEKVDPGDVVAWLLR